MARAFAIAFAAWTALMIAVAAVLLFQVPEDSPESSIVLVMPMIWWGAGMVILVVAAVAVAVIGWLSRHR